MVVAVWRCVCVFFFLSSEGANLVNEKLLGDDVDEIIAIVWFHRFTWCWINEAHLEFLARTRDKHGQWMAVCDEAARHTADYQPENHKWT